MTFRFVSTNQSYLSYFCLNFVLFSPIGELVSTNLHKKYSHESEHFSAFAYTFNL